METLGSACHDMSMRFPIFAVQQINGFISFILIYMLALCSNEKLVIDVVDICYRRLKTGRR